VREKLTDRRIEQLKPADRRIDIWDANLPAFGIRINTNGSKVWVAALRRGGTSSRITLGRFPTMRITEARTRARALMTGEAAAPTPRSTVFADFVARFLAHGRDRRGRPVRPATMRMYRLTLEQIAAPLHRMPINTIRRGDIASLLHEVATERGPASAALTRNVLGRFFGWLIEIDVLEASPVQRSPIYAATRGKRVLSDGEIRAIWHGGEGPFNSILRLCLLLGARRSEVGGMRWSELEDGTWVIPEERVKTHRELKLPLPALAVAEIERQPRIIGRDCIFGRGSTNGFSDWSGSKSRLDRRLGLTKSWDIHDLRRTVRTRLHALRVPHEIVVRILNHDLSEVSATYDHYGYAAELRAALEQWAAELSRIVAQPAAEVIAIG
jgi:integrase